MVIFEFLRAKQIGQFDFALLFEIGQVAFVLIEHYALGAHVDFVLHFVVLRFERENLVTLFGRQEIVGCRVEIVLPIFRELELHVHPEQAADQRAFLAVKIGKATVEFRVARIVGGIRRPIMIGLSPAPDVRALAGVDFRDIGQDDVLNGLFGAAEVTEIRDVRVVVGGLESGPIGGTCCERVEQVCGVDFSDRDLSLGVGDNPGFLDVTGLTGGLSEQINQVTDYAQERNNHCH